MASTEPFDPEQRAVLERVLGTTRREAPPLSYPQVAGFLYAVVACPDAVQPSEWLEAVLGDEGSPVAERDDLEDLIGALMALNNHASEQFFADAPACPPGCEPPGDPSALGEETGFGQFAEGLMIGQSWLRQSWEASATEEQLEGIDWMLGTLHALRGPAAAEEILRDGREAGMTVMYAVDELLAELLPEAHSSLAGFFDIAMEMREGPPPAAPPVAGRVETYRREQPRVGRNEPCPCGSGRKYKRCCGRRDR